MAIVAKIWENPELPLTNFTKNLEKIQNKIRDRDFPDFLKFSVVGVFGIIFYCIENTFYKENEDNEQLKITGQTADEDHFTNNYNDV